MHTAFDSGASPVSAEFCLFAEAALAAAGEPGTIVPSAFLTLPSRSARSRPPFAPRAAGSRRYGIALSSDSHTHGAIVLAPGAHRSAPEFLLDDSCLKGISLPTPLLRRRERFPCGLGFCAATSELH